MINKVSVETNLRIINSKSARKNENIASQQNPNFKGLGGVLLTGMQACERMPMVNVAVIDMLSAILPRTIVESMTNWFAGFEAFRRESSGLVVNCLIPSLITLGIAKGINGGFMPKGVDMSECWADSSMIDKAKTYYMEASSPDKVKESLRNIIADTEGFEGKNKLSFKDILSKEELDSYAEKLAKLTREDMPKKSLAQKINHGFKVCIGKEKREIDPVTEIANSIVEKTRIAENLKVAGKGDAVTASSVNTLLKDSVKFYKGLQKAGDKITVEEFAKRSKNLVRTKSGLGLAVVLPLAISMQYINRWITGKLSGVKGAPIYDDFGKNGKESIEDAPKSKEGLLKQKIISISSMIGVSLLSMMKKPTLGMLEFKGMFPTMDQARIISTATFASRMAAADDKNELAEATVRDIATFSSLYFLGDYAAKAAATVIQNKTGIKLLNETKQLDKDANVFQKAWHWVKDINIKSSEEVVSATEEGLKAKGLKPTAEQLNIIKKELKHATNLRSACQGTSIGVSLALLGIVIPIFTRKNTKKKHEQALKLAQESSPVTADKNEAKESVTPLNVKYSKLTAGFRADKR